MQEIDSVSFNGNFYNLYSSSDSQKRVLIEGGKYCNKFIFFTKYGDFTIKLNKENFYFYNEDKSTDLIFNIKSIAKSININNYYAYKNISFNAGINYLKIDKQSFFEYNTNVGLFFQNIEEPNLELSYSKSLLPFNLFASYKTENFEIINPFSLYKLNQTLRYKLNKTFFVFNLAKFIPQNNFKNSINTIFNRNSIINFSLGIEIKNYKQKIKVEYEQLNADGSFEFEQENLSYGYLKIENLKLIKNVITYSHKYENKTLNVSSSYYYLQGNMIGSIESWPFTTVINSLFLNRLYYKLSGKINIQTFDFSICYLFPKITVIPKLSFIRVLPGFTLETWQPVFLVFGKSNYGLSKVNFKEMGIAYLNISAIFYVSKIRFSVDGNQIIPIYSIKEKTVMGTVSTAPSTNDTQIKSNSDGGRWFSLQVGIPLMW